MEQFISKQFGISISPSQSGIASGHSRVIPTDDEDSVLVRRSCAGDQAAYVKLVERHERRVTNLISHILHSHLRSQGYVNSDVEDLVQETFVQAWKALKSFRSESKFSTWLYRIAVNRALRERKRLQSGFATTVNTDFEISSDLAVSRFDQIDPASELCAVDRNAEILAAVESLPEKQRLVIILKFYDSCSCEEIASILGCTVGTVWSRVHYGCLKLKQILGEMDQTD
jgi:RNA polymerase sigma-70 factor (ECF subfamily)